MEVFKNKKLFVALILAVAVGLFVRAWKINTLPYPPSGDELAFGYYGWSLLNFGTDEYGNKLPMYFPSIGDYKYPVLAYLNTLPAAIFGLSDITIRFWSLAAGVGIIVLAAMTAEVAFSSGMVGVAAAWMVSLNPWSVALSRASYESNVAVMLASIFLLVFWKFLKGKGGDQRKYLIASMVLFLLTIFCYSATRVFFAAFLSLTFLATFINKDWRKWTKPVGVVLLLVMLLSFLSFIPWESRSRAGAVTITNLRHEEKNRLEELYVEAGISPIHLPPRVTWFFHNKWRVVMFSFLKEYTTYFSPRFLFFSGQPSNEAIPEMGVLLLVQILLFPVGLLMIIRKMERFEVAMVVAWLLSAPLAASLTPDGPNMVRSAMMIPAIAMISGYGLVQVINLNKSRAYKGLAWTALGVGTLWSSLFFLNQLLVQKPVSAPWTTHQGTKEMVKDVYQMRNDYKAVAIGEDNYIAFLYYNQITPKEFLSRSTILEKSDKIQWDRVERLDNIHFKMPFECPKTGKAGVLYVCRGMNIAQNAKIIKVYRFLDGIPHYTLLTFVPYKEIDGKPLPGLPDRLNYIPDRDSKYPTGIIPDSEPSYW